MFRTIRIFVYLLLAVIVSGGTVSCKSHDDPEQKATPQLTIFIHQPTTKGANPDLTSYMDADLKEVNQAIKNGLLEKANVICFRSDLSTGRLYQKELVKSSNGTDTVQDKLLKEYPVVETDYTTYSGLNKILSDVISAGRTEKIGMIIGCHADGWLPTDKDKSSRTAVSGKDIRKSFGQGYHGDYDTSYKTLGKAIEATGRKFEFILLDNCNSQNIEVAYDLRNSCKYLIGSVTEIGANGQQYSDCMQLLAAADYQGVCNNYYDYYVTSGSWSATLSALDCSVMDEMAAVMKKINQGNKNEVLRSSVQVLDGFDKSTTYRYNVFYDFGDYVNKLCADEALLAEFQAVLARLVVANVYTEEYYSAYFGDVIVNGMIRPYARPINSCSGVTCSDPCTEKQTDWQQTGWYQATH